MPPPDLRPPGSASRPHGSASRPPGSASLLPGSALPGSASLLPGSASPDSTTPRRIPTRLRLRWWFLRTAIQFLVGAVMPVRFEGRERLPDGPYVVCFNHPSWLDPFVLIGFWPGKRPLYILGPKEQDMGVGVKNRLITWSARGVPLRPGKDDLLDTTRRAMAVLDRGGVLAVAGEGQLSEREGEVLPLLSGPAFFALRARVPLVPVAIVGTRWLAWGRRIRVRIGSPIETGGRRSDRAAIRAVTASLQGELDRLVAEGGVRPAPGRFGRWLTEVFNDRS